MSRPHLREDGIPTRCDRLLMTPAELAILAAIDAVEDAGASTALTDALTLLVKARDRVADHVEGVPGALGAMSIEECDRTTRHALVPGTGYCACTHTMYDQDPVLVVDDQIRFHAEGGG